jgi:replication factor A1
MIKIPHEQVIEKIKEKTELSDQEISSKIDAKLKQLSGLISKEGAAHIIANELGVKLFEKVSGRLQIKNILTGMRDVEAVGKVMQVYEPREFQSNNRTGRVGSFILGDETGTIRVTCWGNQCDKFTSFSQGSLVKVSGGYVKENNSSKEVHLNDRSSLIVNPRGETVGEVQYTQQAQQAARKSIADLSESDSRVEVLGTIVQAFEPKYYEVCSQCGKRAKPQGDDFVCPQHSVVAPDYAYVLNAFLDDGTENVRIVFFRDQADTLLGRTKEQMQALRQKPEEFEPLKTELLGNIIKVTGRVTRNQMFDRIEIIASDVDTSPDPEKEISRLESQKD